MMAPLAFVSLVGLSLLVQQVTAADELPTASVASLTCLTQMNELRTAAGLPSFTEEKLLPEDKGGSQQRAVEDFWQKACQKIMMPSSNPKASGELPQGTYAYFRTSENTGNCAAAVEYWKDGFTLFNNKLPEKYSASNSGIYGNEKAVSFVALFNPKPEAKVNCAFVKCSAATTSSSTKPPGSTGGNGGRRLSEGAEESSTTNAVVCLTSPEALVNDAAPFSQEQWDKITLAMSNGVSSTGSTALVALAAAALSASVFL